MNEKLPTILKLKSSKQITTLFANGQSVKAFPIILAYMPCELEVPFKVGFSVSKRNFKTAVDRNRIKRLLRENFRKNKYLFTDKNDQTFLLMFLFVGKELPNYQQINKAILKVAKRWQEKKDKSI